MVKKIAGAALIAFITQMNLGGVALAITATTSTDTKIYTATTAVVPTSTVTTSTSATTSAPTPAATSIDSLSFVGGTASPVITSAPTPAPSAPVAAPPVPAPPTPSVTSPTPPVTTGTTPTDVETLPTLSWKKDPSIIDEGTKQISIIVTGKPTGPPANDILNGYQIPTLEELLLEVLLGTISDKKAMEKLIEIDTWITDMVINSKTLIDEDTLKLIQSWHDTIYQLINPETAYPDGFAKPPATT